MLFQTNSKIRAQKFVSELKRLRVCGAQVSVLDRWPAHTDCQEHTEFIQFHLLVKRQYFNRSAAQKQQDDVGVMLLDIMCFQKIHRGLIAQDKHFPDRLQFCVRLLCDCGWRILTESLSTSPLSTRSRQSCLSSLSSREGRPGYMVEPPERTMCLQNSALKEEKERHIYVFISKKKN